MEVLAKKNGYALVKVTDGVYTYGSEKTVLGEGFEPELKGTPLAMIKSCRNALRGNRRNVKKYTERNMPLVVRFLEEQREALEEFIGLLKNVD